MTNTGRGPRLADTALAAGFDAAVSKTWGLKPRRNTLEVAYGAGKRRPQYAALHLKSSYFRLNTGPGSGWGTSVILLPAFWSGGQLQQGAPLTYSSSVQNGDLIISFKGSMMSLWFTGSVRISPPTASSITADVAISVRGDVALDTRPGEAFQFAKMSSMHISATQWDARAALVDGFPYAIPAEQWILNPPLTGRTFGLVGGTSAWKTLAPNIEVVLDQQAPIAGWVTLSANPNDDGIGFWTASPSIVRQIHYTVVARR